MNKPDFTKTYGEVPASFVYRVEYTLRQCQKEENNPMKRKKCIIILATVLCLAMTTTAIAAVLSNTVDFFNLHYGGRFSEELESGKHVTGGQSIEMHGVVFTLSDAVISDHVTTWGDNDRELNTLAFWATGFVSAAEGENIILLAGDDYCVDDAAGYALYYGDMYPAAPEGAKTYAELAQEKCAVIRVVRAIPNGILDENGELYPTTPGASFIPHEDGTVEFSVEIMSETEVPVQESYQLSMYLWVEDVDLMGNPIEGTSHAQDWIVTLTPDKAE